MHALHHPATTISLVALFVATAGGAFAAGRTLIPGSQIKPHSIPLSALAPAAVAALRGHNGADGAQGQPGANGTFDPAKVTVVRGPGLTVAINNLGQATAYCPAGQVAVGGGGYAGIDGLASSIPLGSPPTGWYVATYDQTASGATVQAFAVCAAP